MILCTNVHWPIFDIAPSKWVSRLKLTSKMASVWFPVKLEIWHFPNDVSDHDLIFLSLGSASDTRAAVA